MNPDEASARLFAGLVGNLLAAHEQREVIALDKLTMSIELLRHDLRSLHLQTAEHGTSIAKLRVEILDIRARLDQLEAEVLELRK